jgi:hypothetical protein
LIGHQAQSGSNTFVIHDVDLKISLSIDVIWNCEFVDHHLAWAEINENVVDLMATTKRHIG